MNALCFTVEIDNKHFPDICDFMNKLDNEDILYMSNEYDLARDASGTCYRFEFDNEAIRPVSRLLADLVKNNYLKHYANCIIDINYHSVDANDKKSVVSGVIDCADTAELSCLIGKFISENMHIHLGGFVLFRLREYLTAFEDEIDFAVDEYMQEKRYHDFVRFLRFYVDMQEITVDEVNLYLESRDRYKLLDKYGIPIRNELLDSTYCEISDIEDDGYIMLNDLIALAPGHINVHCARVATNEEIVRTIEEIFSERVTLFRY